MDFFFTALIFREREREGKGGGEKERERETHTETEIKICLLFHLFVHSLVDFYIRPDWGSNPQPWHIGTML